MRVSSGAPIDPALGFPINYNAGDGDRNRWAAVGARLPVYPRPLATERTLAIIATGQSVMANWGAGTLYTPTNARSHHLNILDGCVYPAGDPVLGMDGTGSSPFSALGDKLIAAAKYDRVIVAGVGFGSTRSSQWASGTGTLARGYKIAYGLLRAFGHTNIIQAHQQGEGDAADAVAQATYLANLQAMIAWKKAANMNCPMYVALATFSYGWVTTDPQPRNWTPGGVASGIRAAQLAIVDNIDAFAGPDTDAAHTAANEGSTHWQTQAEVLACADAWVTALPAGR